MRKITRDEFIARSTDTHNAKYDYSLVEYVNAYTKVKIICPSHGEFEQIARNHTGGRGCSICNAPVINTRSFIIKAQSIHGGKYDYSKSEYTRNNYKIKIICPIHGEFEQTADSHLRGRGCKGCHSDRFTTKTFITRSTSVHGDRYDYSLTDYTGAINKVKIICNTHGEFEQNASSHLSGSGCPSCSVSGFDMEKQGTLYILRSNCGMYFKAGISNNSKRRIVELRRRTPFEFEPIAKINNSGDVIFKLEKAFHSGFESAQMKGFDGCTEWFKWDASVNDWISTLSI